MTPITFLGKRYYTVKAISEVPRVGSQKHHRIHMNKTLEALLRGYVLFDVNGQRFWRYNTALAQRKATLGDVEFKGWHIFKGWRMFYLSYTTGRRKHETN